MDFVGPGFLNSLEILVIKSGILILRINHYRDSRFLHTDEYLVPISRIFQSTGSGPVVLPIFDFRIGPASYTEEILTHMGRFISTAQLCVTGCDSAQL
jgi:hypothetical protein